MAEAAYREYLRFTGEDGVEVSSRGLAATGEETAPHAVSALKEAGIDFPSRRSRNLSPEDLSAADYIYVMSAGQEAVLRRAGVPESKLTCLNIPDPYGGDEECYGETLRALFAALPGIAERVSGYSVLPFKEGDVKAAAEIERECFSRPWSEESIASSLSGGTVYLMARSGGEPAGYAGVKVIEETAYIDNVAVLKEYRERGIGRALISALIYTASREGAGEITLEVRPSNAAALSLYGKLGFRRVGLRRKYYEAPVEDALLLTKALSGGAGAEPPTGNADAKPADGNASANPSSESVEYGGSAASESPLGRAGCGGGAATEPLFGSMVAEPPDDSTVAEPPDGNATSEPPDGSAG